MKHQTAGLITYRGWSPEQWQVAADHRVDVCPCEACRHVAIAIPVVLRTALMSTLLPLTEPERVSAAQLVLIQDTWREKFGDFREPGDA